MIKRGSSLSFCYKSWNSERDSEDHTEDRVGRDGWCRREASSRLDGECHPMFELSTDYSNRILCKNRVIKHKVDLIYFRT